jgi:hypothetical protein
MEIQGLKELFRGQGQGAGSGSAGLQAAAQNLTPRSRGMSEGDDDDDDDDEGVGMGGGDDEMVAGGGNNNRQYGNFDNPGWSFDGLDDDDTTADHDAEMLLDKVDDDDDEADADSNAAEQDFDDDRGGDFDDRMQTPTTSWIDRDEERSITFGGPSDDYEDDHGMYSSHVRHVEDASMTSVGDDGDGYDRDGDGGDAEPPAVEINLSSSDDSHGKMD